MKRMIGFLVFASLVSCGVSAVSVFENESGHMVICLSSLESDYIRECLKAGEWYCSGRYAIEAFFQACRLIGIPTSLCAKIGLGLNSSLDPIGLTVVSRWELAMCEAVRMADHGETCIRFDKTVREMYDQANGLNLIGTAGDLLAIPKIVNAFNWIFNVGVYVARR